MKKILLLGDSITEGIGKKKLNYEKILKEKIGKSYEIVNYSLTGTTVDYTEKLISSIKKESPDIIIIMYGNVDVQYRPDLRKNKYKVISLIPRHYKEVKGILHPRPYYSKKRVKYIIHIIDNMVRHIIKKIVILTQGWYQLFNTDEFLNNYKKEIKNLLNINTNIKLICISTVCCDDKIYNYSNNQYEIINEGIHSICKQNKNCYFIDVYNILKNQINKHGWNTLYYKDHFHPNYLGYEIISNEIIKKLEEINEKDNKVY